MSYSGLGIVRSLGRLGVPIYALDPNPKQIGMDSRFCKSKVCPSIESNEEEHIEFLIQLSNSLGQKPVLFPTGDNTVLCYAKHEDMLRNYFLFTVPERRTIERLVTKDALFETAMEFNIPTPATFMPNSSTEVYNIASRISYPCIIKPIRSNSWHQEAIQRIIGDGAKVILARNRNELLSSYSKVAAYDSNVVISEVIPGDDSELFYFVFYMSTDHELLGRFSGRKCRVTPIHFGSASFVESVFVEELDELSISFLRNLKYTGLGGIEFKRDPRDGKFKLIEFNARYGLWDMLGTRCGVDTAYIAYCDATGTRVTKKFEYRTGVKWVSIYRDTKAFLAYRKEGLITLLSWLRSFRGETQWAVFAWDDIKPFLSSIGRYWLYKLIKIV
jgi:predicted ATP-grasp superfamily ATP-dependent carboligase